MTVAESHEITFNLDKDLHNAYGDVNVLVHVEPYKEEEQQKDTTLSMS